MGHSGKVAEKHYLQVTDEHWTRAANLSPIASPIDNHSKPIKGTHKTKKPSVLLGDDGCRGSVNPYLVTPTGLELSQESQGNRGGFGICPPSVHGKLNNYVNFMVLGDSALKSLLSYKGVSKALTVQPLRHRST
jgi:hypothetical protein